MRRSISFLHFFCYQPYAAMRRSISFLHFFCYQPYAALRRRLILILPPTGGKGGEVSPRCGYLGNIFLDSSAKNLMPRCGEAFRFYIFSATNLMPLCGEAFRFCTSSATNLMPRCGEG